MEVFQPFYLIKTGFFLLNFFFLGGIYSKKHYKKEKVVHYIKV